MANLFDADGLPKPFSKPPRLTVYRRELYDYAECINLAILLQRPLSRARQDLVAWFSTICFSRWQKPDGSFRARELLVGWDNVPMHRWAQSQVFRSLCFFLSQEPTRLPKATGFTADALLSAAIRGQQTRELLCAAFADNITSEIWRPSGVRTSRR